MYYSSWERWKRDSQKKIGFIGGTFDPVHWLHIFMGAKAIEEGLDKVLFIPNNIPPHKDKPVLPAHLRVHLLKKAIKHKLNPLRRKMEVWEGEIKRGGVSYTFETVKQLKEEFGRQTQLYMILGEDSWRSFHKWKNPELILSEIDGVIVVPRDQRTWRELTVGAPPGVDKIIRKIDKEKVEIRVIYVPPCPISSSMIRDLIKKGKEFFFLVPPWLAPEIKKLYKKYL